MLGYSWVTSRLIIFSRNQITGWLFFLTQFLGVDFSLSQTINIEQSRLLYSISPVYDFKRGIVSITFDDGYTSQFGLGLRALNRFNFPATFYLVSDFIDSVKAIELKRNLPFEHEIGSHSKHHNHLKSIDNNCLIEEIYGSRYQLEKLLERRVLTFAYPWGEFDQNIKSTVSKFYIASRSANLGYNWLDRIDYYGLKVQAFNQGVESRTADKWVDFAIKNRCWLVEMIHGLEGDGYLPLDSADFVSHLGYINEKKDDLWVATVSDVIKYVSEASKTKVSCINCSDSLYYLTIDDELNDSIYNQEISIEFRIPDDWQQVNVHGAELFKIKYSGGNSFALINVLPSENPITIEPKSFKELVSHNNIRWVYQGQNPFVDKIRVAIYLPKVDDISVNLIAFNGAVLVHGYQSNVAGDVEILLPTSSLPDGLYILHIDSRNSGKLTTKMVKSHLFSNEP